MIGTCMMGLMYLLPGMFCFLFEIWPQYQKRVSFFGLACCVTGPIVASFCKTVPQLIPSQGLLFGLGGAILFANNLVLIPHWWNERIGFATGLIWGASGFSSKFILPFSFGALANFASSCCPSKCFGKPAWQNTSPMDTSRYRSSHVGPRRRPLLYETSWSTSASKTRRPEGLCVVSCQTRLEA